MLRHSFIHIPGVGRNTERKLWTQGICSWDDAAKIIAAPRGLRAVAITVRKYLPKSLRAVARRDASFFDRLARFGEAWRLFSEFRDDCVYVDIETTGLSPNYDHVTIAGIFDGKKYRVFVRGENLTDLPSHLRKYAVAVTFNGSGFDLPFLRQTLASSVPQGHIDLRWVAYRLGYKGGLKEIEHRFGLKRSKRIAGMNGFDAVILWHRYRRGDKYALEQLIEYNRADVMNLQPMMQHAYEELVNRAAKFFPSSQRAFAAAAR